MADEQLPNSHGPSLVKLENLRGQFEGCQQPEDKVNGSTEALAHAGTWPSALMTSDGKDLGGHGGQIVGRRKTRVGVRVSD